MKKILTLIDGSAYAKPACEYTAWMAEDAQVELLNVIEKPKAPTDDHSGAIRLGARTKLLEELAALDHERAKLQLQHGRAILDDAKALLKTLDVDASETLRHGDIVDAQGDIDHDMLVIGKRGEQTDFESGHLGGNLDRVLNASKTPVFVVNRTLLDIKNVLVAYDGGESADRLVELLADHPKFLGSKTVLVYVGEEKAELRTKLSAAEAKLAASGVKLRTIVKAGEVGDVMSAMIKDENIDMIAMGTNKHSRLRSFFVNPSSKPSLLNNQVPILIAK